jgi:outer membrane protein OmpA-like peptidoglycan-associated protein
MNKFKWHNRLGGYSILCLVLSLYFVPLIQNPAFCSESPADLSSVKQSIPTLPNGMYVIVGAFQIPENAIQYSQSIKVDGKTPKVGKYQQNGMYYVYAIYTKDDLEMARSKRGSLRATRQFYDAWILYVGVKPEDFEKTPVEEFEETPDRLVINQPKELKPAEMKAGEAMDMVPPPPVQQDQNTYNYRFNVIGATTLKEVPGYVTIIDATRNKAMKSVSTNQIHPLEAPTTQSKEIIALCDIFGYVKEQAKFKIDDPMSSEDKSMLTETGGVTTVKFELQRHKVGDILTMYNVYFYNDAAIMKPESKFELTSLLAMLKENEKLTVKIHGHTNGNDPGKLIKLRPDDHNYFEVTANNIETMSSAKDLSKERAEVIKRWLIDQDIDEKRMEVKAWGGSKMIYKKTDTMAGKNVRVEVEIVKE